MSAALFFYRNLSAGAETLPLPEDTARHVFQVLRMTSGASIRLTDGQGTEAEGVIEQTGKKTGTFHVEKWICHERPYGGLHLGIAFTRNAGRNEWLLEKAAELGVARIIPLQTSRSEKIHIREERCLHILTAGLIQSQRFFLPQLEKPLRLDALVQHTMHFSRKLIAHCDPRYERIPLLDALRPAEDTVVLIGPEGDFSGAEIEQCMQHDFTGVILSAARLRTETAAMAVCVAYDLIQPN